MTPSWARWVNVSALVLAVGTIAFLVLLPSGNRAAWIGVLAAATAAIYIGFGLADGRLSHMGLEAAFALALIATAAVGTLTAPLVLAAVMFVHGLWDLLHHRRFRLVRTRAVPVWYPSACLIYDVLVGGAITVLVR